MALEVHGVGSGGHVLMALAHDGLSKHRGGSGSVSGDVGGLTGHLLHHLGAEVLNFVFKGNLLGYRHAVFGYVRSAKRLLDDYVASLGA